MFSSAQFRDRLLKYADINFDTGDATVPGTIVVNSNGSLIGNYTGLPAISRSDVNGNLLGNFIELSGNITTAYFFGDGSKISGISNGPLPSTIRTDVTGNLTGATANVVGTMATTAFFLGNGTFISNVVTQLPRQANADILRGNIMAAGNVDAQNVTARIVRVSGPSFVEGQVNVVANVTGLYLIGNGALLTKVTGTLPKSANMNIVGNVVAPTVGASNVSTGILRSYGNTIITGQVNVIGNVYGNLSGNGVFLTNVFTGNLSRNVIGNVTAPGNITAGLFVGDGKYLELNGDTIQPQGNVPNQAARLALPSGVGTIVTQDDIQRQFLLTNTPASSNANWIEFSGNNFPVTSVFNRLGDVVLISGTDIQSINGQSIAGSGDITAANLDIRGNVVSSNVRMTNVITTTATFGNVEVTGQVNVSGNTTAVYYFGNASGVTNVGSLSLPSRGNLNIIGNVTAPSATTGNVDAANISSNVGTVTGNVLISGNLTLTNGNVNSTGFLYGNGSQLQGVLPSFSARSDINVFGNVSAPANVDSVNVSTTILQVTNMFVSANITNSLANVVANTFIGNGFLLTGANAVLVNGQSINVIGNVSAAGNVDAANVTTTLLRTFGNVRVTSQINVTGNVTAPFFYGNGLTLTSISANLSTSQVMNVFGNVRSFANVDAGNLTSNSILIVDGNVFVGTGGQVNVIGNVIANTFIGNGAFLTGVQSSVTASQTINVFGNVVFAPGNVNAANVTTNILFANGNIVSTGQLFTVTGNVIANVFFGNGAFLTNLVGTGTQNVNIIGNVSASGNVDASNVTANAMTVRGNAVVGALDVNANITAQFYIGDGSRITNIPACTAPTSVCFVQPSTGFTSNTFCLDYAPTNGWSFVLPSNSRPQTIGIQTYSLPLDPSQPFSGLPSNVTQTVSTPWAFSNGIWTSNVQLTSNGQFGPISVNMGFSNYFGRYLGNSSNTVMSSVAIPNVLGFTNVDNNIPVFMIASYINPTTGNISLCFQGKGQSFLGRTWLNGIIYYALVDKNFNNLLGWNQIIWAQLRQLESVANLVAYAGTNTGYFVSENELYLSWTDNVNADTSNISTWCFFSNLSSSSMQAKGTGSIRYPYFARLNPNAQVAVWSSAFIPPPLTSPVGWLTDGTTKISISPDRTKLFTTFQLTTANVNQSNLSYFVNFTQPLFPWVGNISPTGPNFYHGMMAGIHTANGFPIIGSVSDYVANIDSATAVPMSIQTYSDAWSEDSNIAYYTVGTFEPSSLPYYLRVSSAQVASTPATFSQFAPFFARINSLGNSQFNYLAFTMGRVPFGSLRTSNNPTWFTSQSSANTTIMIGNAFTPSYFIRPGAITYSGDGNIWFAATIYKNTSYTGNASFTFCGNTITTPTINTSGLGFIGLWKIQDDSSIAINPANITSLTLLSNSSETSNTSKYVACAVTQSISMGRNTAKGVGVMQISSISNISNITFATPFGNVACAGLTNPSNTRLTSFDIYPNLWVDGFNAVSNVLIANACNGERITFGNVIDYNYSLQSLLPAFAKLNIDNIP